MRLLQWEFPNYKGRKIDCGLFSLKAKDLLALNMPISTCQNYVCIQCCYRTNESIQPKFNTSLYDSIVPGKENI